MLNLRRVISVSGLLAVTWLVPAFGGAVFTIQKDTRYTQTSTSAPTTPDGFDFFATVRPNPSDTFDGGNVVGPAGFGTQTLTNQGGGSLQYGSGVIATQFPTGTYTFNVTDSVTPANNTSVAVDDTTEVFPNAIPAISGASYTALQGFDATKPFTLMFNSFTSADGLIFLDILNLNTSTFSFVDALQPNAGQDTIPANTLTNGTPYKFFLFFTNTVVTGNSPGPVTQEQLSNRTIGFFTTQSAAVPEPSSAFLGMLGIAAIYALKRKRGD
jgi:hypothetical protein